MKRLAWFMASAILFVGTTTTPIRLQADGNPPPNCPTGKNTCKPAAMSALGS